MKFKLRCKRYRVEYNETFKKDNTELHYFCFQYDLIDPNNGDCFSVRQNNFPKFSSYKYYFVGKTNGTYSQSKIFKASSDDFYDEKNLEIDLDPVELELTDDGYVKVKDSEDYFHYIVVDLWGDCYNNRSIPDNTYQIDHLDGNKQNNQPSNLEIVPAIVNLYRAAKNHYNMGADTTAERKFLDTLSSGTIEDFDKILEELERYEKAF
jgi:hypothetical protein